MVGLLVMVLSLARVATSLTAVHPMHTAVAELGYDPASRAASIQIRVFADDLYAALEENPAPTEAGAISRYLEGKFELFDQMGRALPLDWLGVERAGDVLLLRLAARVPAGLAGARVTSTVLCERFPDQVNIVRASYGGRTSTLVFVRGDPAKQLP